MNNSDVLLMTTTLYVIVLAVIAVVIGASTYGLVGVALFLAGVLFGWITSP